MCGMGIVLSALLRLTRITQRELAGSLGIKRSTLAGWLAGYAPMPDEVVLRIHHLLGQRLDAISRVNPTEQGDLATRRPPAMEP